MDPKYETTSTAPKVAEKGNMTTEDPIQLNPHTNFNSLDPNDVDCEKHGASRESNPLPDLKRKLKSRHLQMIAIGQF